MTAEEKILEAGYDDVVIFSDFSYDDALVGVSHDFRAIYDYDKMVDWLITHEGFESCEEAADWICYNTIRSLDYVANSPIVMYGIME